MFMDKKNYIIKMYILQKGNYRFNLIPIKIKWHISKNYNTYSNNTYETIKGPKEPQQS